MYVCVRMCIYTSGIKKKNEELLNRINYSKTDSEVSFTL